MKTQRRSPLSRAALTIAAITLSLAVRAQAQTESVLYSFTGTDGNGPFASLTFDQAGNLYGTTVRGGANDAGAVFMLTPVAGGGWKETVIHSFAGGADDGAFPWGGLVIDSAGTLYGTTYFGGSLDYGTVFALTPTAGGVWNESIVHFFRGSWDGGNPHAGLTLDNAGNLYGTTFFGGPFGQGMVFVFTPTSTGWKESTLHYFTGGFDGGYPSAQLTFDASGNLFGTTTSGGTRHLGVVFKLTPTTSGPWKQTLVHNFAGGIDGASPTGRLILDASGNLYGTAVNGGDLTTCSGFGCGTVFRLTPTSKGGWRESVLHTFSGGADGAYPYGGLAFDRTGSLYGTAYYGGDLTACAGAGCGNVFKVTHQTGGWLQTVVYTFTGSPSDGGSPYVNLIFDGSGNLYGTAPGGGAGGDGVVFKIAP